MTTIQFGCQSKRIMKGSEFKLYPGELLVIQGKLLVKFDFEMQKILKRKELHQISNRRIFDISYSIKHQMYMILFDDWYLYFLNNELKLLQQIQIECRQTLYATYIDNDYIVLISQTRVDAYQYDPSKAQILNHKLINTNLAWNKHYKRLLDKLIIFNNRDICFINIQSLDIQLNLKVSEHIIDVEIYEEYFIIGSPSKIIIYDKLNIVHHQFENCHNGGQLQNILVENSYAFSYGTDNKIMKWDLINLSLLGTYTINDDLPTCFTFLTSNSYLFQSEQMIFKGSLDHGLDCVFKHDSQIQVYSENILGFKNHIYYSIKNQKAIYTTQKTKTVRQIIDQGDTSLFLYDEEIAFWNGSQFDFNIDINQIRTMNGDRIYQDIMTIQMSTFQPNFYDVELNFNDNDRRKILFLLNQDKFEDIDLLVLGCSRGAVIFIPMKLPTRVYTRYNFGKDPIIAIHSLTNNILVTIDLANNIRFINKYPQIIKQLYFTELSCSLLMNRMIVIALRTQILLLNSEFMCYQPEQVHDSNILGLNKSQDLFLSFSNNLVRIWTITGQNIQNFQIHSTIDGAIIKQNKIFIVLQGLLCRTQFTMPNTSINSRDVINSFITLDEYFEGYQQQKRQKTKSTESKGSIGPVKSLKKIHMNEVPKLNVNQSQLHMISIRSPSQTRSPINQKLNQRCSIQKSRSPSVENKKFEKSFVLPQIQKQENKVKLSLYAPAIPSINFYVKESILDIYQQRRQRKGAPKNRREYTMEKIIMNNILNNSSQ
ncbi:hypothetical protein pb186bvf_018885 [Paramecium bursaria]